MIILSFSAQSCFISAVALFTATCLTTVLSTNHNNIFLSNSARNLSFFQSGFRSLHPDEIDLGTTLVALVFNDGVVVAADTRTSVSSYVSNRLAKKLTTIKVPNDDSGVVICRSGSAADTQWLANQAQEEFMSRWIYQNQIIPTVSQVAHYVKHVIRKEGSESFSASLICAGRDNDGQGKIYTIARSGTLLQESNFAASGSGSTYLIGYLDNYFREKGGSIIPSEQEAIELASRLVNLSMTRDGSSGGFVRLTVINSNGRREFHLNPESTTTTTNNNDSINGSAPQTSATLEGFANAKPISEKQ